MHDIIVVGGSAGSLDGIVTLLRGFPNSLPASVYFVMHSAESGLVFVPDILQRQSRLEVRVAAMNEAIRRGVVYVPPSGHHLLLKSKRVVVNRGPKQNGFRPAIDPLFTSAAAAFGSRVVGVILSGFLDDGVHGLDEIRQAGGVTIVQDPGDAMVPILPVNALRAVQVDHVVPAARMPALIERIAREPAKKAKAAMKRRTSFEREVRLVESGPTRIPKRPPSPFTCPECDGALWGSHENPPIYRCHVGHTFTPSALLNGQKEVSDQHLWSAVRSLEEQAELHRRYTGGPREQATDFRRHAAALEEQALILRRILIEKSLSGEKRPRAQRRRPPKRGS